MNLFDRLLFSGSLVVLAACQTGWPSPPPRYTGEVPPPVPGDDVLLADVVNEGGTYPEKFYWYEEAQWADVRSELGIVTGRRTTNTPVVRLRRLDGSPDGWPDLCKLSFVSLEQALRSPGEYGRPRVASSQVIQAGHSEVQVDCAVYDAAP